MPILRDSLRTRLDIAEMVVKNLIKNGLRLATAESCTAGLVSDALVNVSGASKAFWGGFVCYTDAAKMKMLGISERLIKEKGAVSREAAHVMAESAFRISGADIAASVTGLAGPDGDGSPVKVGTIWMSVKTRNKIETHGFFYRGKHEDSRAEIRENAAIDLLGLILQVGI